MSNTVTPTEIFEKLKGTSHELTYKTVLAVLNGKGSITSRTYVNIAKSEITKSKYQESILSKIAEVNKEFSYLSASFSVTGNLILVSAFKYFAVSYLDNKQQFAFVTRQSSLDIDLMRKELEIIERIIKILND